MQHSSNQSVNPGSMFGRYRMSLCYDALVHHQDLFERMQDVQLPAHCNAFIHVLYEYVARRDHSNKYCMHITITTKVYQNLEYSEIERNLKSQNYSLEMTMTMTGPCCDE